MYDLTQKYNWIQNSILPSTSDIIFPDKIWLKNKEKGTMVEKPSKPKSNSQPVVFKWISTK